MPDASSVTERDAAIVDRFSGEGRAKRECTMRVLLAALMVASPALADVSGRASVVDGDTLDIRGERVRLWGVDAPEGSQNCRSRNGAAYGCGRAAANALSTWIGRRNVACVEVERDRYGRAVSRCSVAGTDVAGWLAREGHALDYRQYSGGAYAAAEASARAEKRGLWAGAFERPWEWRASQRESQARPPAATAARSGPSCLVKGNISAKGERIYHSPGMRSYAATRISPGRGERWFCTEAEARAAGWRSPRS